MAVRAEGRSHEARAESIVRFVSGIYSALVSRRHPPSFNSNSGAPPRIWTLLADLLCGEMNGADPLERLSARLGHAFRDAALLEQALTHSSFANENPGSRDNGALAFLGDAVLALVVGEHLWRAFPDEPEGVLTPKRAELVSGANLSRWAVGIDLGTHLRLGHGEEQTGGREKESVLATAFEAVLAVVYLEAGLEEARRAVVSLALW